MRMFQARTISDLSWELYSKDDEIKKLRKELYGPSAVAVGKYKPQEKAEANLVPMSPDPGLDYLVGPKTHEEAMLMSQALIISKLSETLQSKNNEIKQLQKKLKDNGVLKYLHDRETGQRHTHPKTLKSAHTKQ